jgi:predicted XRE-type DNA-binding protein
VKIQRVAANNRRKAFEIVAGRRRFVFPYAKAMPRPSDVDQVRNARVDPELGREAFTFVLASGKEGSVHIDHVLEYNNDPATLRDLLLYKLTLEAQRKLERSPLSRREIIRRLGTSPSQLYRLLDQTNYKKSVDQLLNLLHVLDCDVKLVVRTRAAAPA